MPLKVKINTCLEKDDTMNTLSVSYLYKLMRLFNANNWPIYQDKDVFLFNDFCKLLSSMTDEEISLILDLTQNFLWVEETNYYRLFKKTVHNLLSDLNYSEEYTLCFCPLLRKDDLGKCKSSMILIYLIKSHLPELKQYIALFSPNIEVQYIDNPTVCNSIHIDTHHLICLVDDFIGSGDTAIEAINDFLPTSSTPSDSVIVLSLVAMHDGIDRIKSAGYNVYASIIKEKGIKGTPNEAQKYTIMNTIEERIHTNPRNKLGYGQSEALVKMLRTPNNTFPIYWLKNKHNPHAPFPR